PDGSMPPVADRPRADIDPMPAITPAPACPFRDALGPRVVVGKGAILAAGRTGVTLLPGRRGPALEAGEALDDVAEEACLALLGVGDHVDAGRGLLANGVGPRLADEPVVRRAVVRLPAVLRAKDRDESVGPGEAPDVGRQDSVSAPLHRP